MQNILRALQQQLERNREADAAQLNQGMTDTVIGDRSTLVRNLVSDLRVRGIKISAEVSSDWSESDTQLRISLPVETSVTDREVFERNLRSLADKFQKSDGELYISFHHDPAKEHPHGHISMIRILTDVHSGQGEIKRGDLIEDRRIMVKRLADFVWQNHAQLVNQTEH